ncbi:H-NS family nucleoid-associated regulatory protein [Variovorax sp. KK3]|uniref:H-NS family nucleoid-associated regulatory protein n=1 Tax=Variovorax sp. KK3 TaxID=1855728 RepID=UPI00097C0043|nr:H-NS family nucleoid-associated regulatory protein [Variovorax sp. KK3]
MAQTLIQIQKQIEKLQRQADALRSQEIAGVVERIKVAIAHYGLTADQLGLVSTRPSSRATGQATRNTSVSTVVKFSDGNGNSWSGRGPRPLWLRNALQSGRTLDEFASAKGPANGATRRATRSKGKAKALASKQYRDGAGNAWIGRGPRPAWLKAALASGKRLDDFLA